MKIKRVLIKNYRSIKTLELYPEDICALVGENNAGKTNILSALNLLLGETWPTKRSISPTDYHEEDTTQPIFIEVEFHDNPQGFRKIWFTAPWENPAETKIEFKNSDKEYYLKSEWRDKCALVYLDANRSLDYHLGPSNWTLFGRIVRRLDEDFREQFPANDPTDKQLRQHFTDALGLLKTPLYQAFENALKQNFTDQIRRTAHKIEIDFQAFDPQNYYRAIRLLLKEHNELKAASDAGQGMRNMVLLALFRTYAKVFRDDAIIAIEEPEIYLHPHAQRSLYALFCELAAQGAQVFYSTHASTFVDIERFEQIALVERPAMVDRGKIHHRTKIRRVTPEALLQQRQQLHPTIPMTIASLRERYRNICSAKHSEAFFAKKIVLVEGITEEFVLPLVAAKLAYEFDANGVSVVNADGKDNLDALYHLYQAFGIPTFVIFDGDRGNAQKTSRNRTLLRMLGQPETDDPDQVIESNYAVLQTDFEDALKRSLEAYLPGQYDTLHTQATQELGGNAGKGLVARFITRQLIIASDTDPHAIPGHIRQIIDNIRKLGEPEPDTSGIVSHWQIDNEIDVPF